MGSGLPSVHIGGDVGGVINDATLGGTGALGITDNSYIDDKLLKPKRDDLHKKEDKLASEKAVTDALGMNELGQYKTALAGVDQFDPNKVTLSKSEIAWLDKSQHNQETRVKAMMANMGILNSTMATAMLNNIDNDRVIAEGQLLTKDKEFVFQQKKEAFAEAHTHFQNALQALGISNAYMQEAMKIDEAYSAQLMQEWTALIGAGATIAGGAMGGPGGAAAGAATAKAATSSFAPAPTPGYAQVPALPNLY